VTICIIHTGGTIAMRAGPDGLAPAGGVLEDGLAALARAGIARGETKVVHLTPAIDSANARFADWNRIAEVIFDGQSRYAGFVVTHGTDTLAYTAAALCFALVGIARPVIVTGSMLPLEAAGTDARQNLGDALLAATRAPAGIWVQFADKLMAGARVRKAHSHARDAFSARDGGATVRSGTSALLAFGAPEIAVLSMAPNTSPRAFAAALGAVDGAVMRVFGAGTIPNDPAIEEALMDASARGVLMIAVSQCEGGGTALGTYAAGAVMARAGVVDGGQITESAAYAKLAHALAHGGRDALASDLCGEMA
jgi:L-asparaginase